MLKNRITSIFFYIIIVVVICVCSFGCSKGSSQPPNTIEQKQPVATPVLEPIDGFTVYENSKFNFRIQYPDDWEKMDGDSGVAFIIPDSDIDDIQYEGFNILFEQMYGMNMSLEEYMKVTDEGLKKYMPGFTLLDSGESTLGGHPAARMVFIAKPESQEMKFFSMFAIRKGNVYSLSFNSLPQYFDKLQDDLQKIIGSFQFLD